MDTNNQESGQSTANTKRCDVLNPNPYDGKFEEESAKTARGLKLQVGS